MLLLCFPLQRPAHKFCGISGGLSCCQAGSSFAVGFVGPVASLPAKPGNNTKQNKLQLHEISGVVTFIQACRPLRKLRFRQLQCRDIPPESRSLPPLFNCCRLPVRPLRLTEQEPYSLSDDIAEYTRELCKKEGGRHGCSVPYTQGATRRR